MTVFIEELVENIIQVTVRGEWDSAAWDECRLALLQAVRLKDAPTYWLFDMRTATQVDEDAFADMVLSPIFSEAKIGLAIMVGRKIHLKAARALLDTHPHVRDHVNLRLMTSSEDAYRNLLDRQVMDRIQRVGTS